MRPSTSPTTTWRRRGAVFIVGAIVLALMWAIFMLRHLRRAWMTPGARLSAAIEVIADIEARRRPAADALKDWGLAHRFAGSGDRAAIAGLVFDALRRQGLGGLSDGRAIARARSCSACCGSSAGLAVSAIARAGQRRGVFARPRSSARANNRGWSLPMLPMRPAWVAGDYPQWLDAHLARVFGEDRAAEGAALARRAPLDLRVNTLKADRERGRSSRSLISIAVPTRWSPFGLRIVLGAEAKSPADPCRAGLHQGDGRGAGRRLTACGAAGRRAKPGEQVIDLCAGAGGKTLALAAMMKNRGQIYATDLDKRRLAPIHSRLERAGVHNVQVRTPKGGAEPAGRSRRSRRSRADRRALHRHRRLAAQSRRQMADASRRARSAHARAGRCCSIAPPPW